MKTMHTKGPWKAGFVADSDSKLVWQAVEAEDGFELATVGRYLHRYTLGSSRPKREILPEEAAANVRLIAAAPELLAALRQIVEGDIDPNVGFSFAKGLFREAAPTWMAAADAAIAKATGQ